MIVQPNNLFAGFRLPMLPVRSYQISEPVRYRCRFDIGRLIKTLGSVAMRCHSHLSDDEREQIGLLKALGHSIGAIAQAIGRPKSSISRELSRNRLQWALLATSRRRRLRRRREAIIERDRALQTFVLDRLAER
jgi:hypothetical protein